MRLLVAALIGLTAAPALAQTPVVTAEKAWARATTPRQSVGGIFFTLTDTGAPDRLVAVSSPIAATLELHETIKDGDVMKMRPVRGLPIAAGQSVELKPGGYHVMAMGLKQPLTPGNTFPMTLTFEKAPPVTVTVTVGTAGASGPGADHAMDHGAMHKMP